MENDVVACDALFFVSLFVLIRTVAKQHIVSHVVQAHRRLDPLDYKYQNYFGDTCKPKTIRFRFSIWDHLHIQQRQHLNANMRQKHKSTKELFY